MKKKLILLFALSCALVFSACNKKEEPEPIKEEPEVIEEEPEPEPEEPQITVMAIIEHLNEEGYELPLDDEYFEESFTNALEAQEGYRYYDLETLQTTEIYMFDEEEYTEEDLEEFEIVDQVIKPTFVIRNIIIFTEDIELIKIVNVFVTGEELDEETIDLLVQKITESLQEETEEPSEEKTNSGNNNSSGSNNNNTNTNNNTNNSTNTNDSGEEPSETPEPPKEPTPPPVQETRPDPPKEEISSTSGPGEPAIPSVSGPNYN